jgi:hypothetical protein
MISKIMAIAFEGMLHMYFGHLNQIKAAERNRKDEADFLSIFMDGAAKK